jgi:hypothetical protein
MAALKDALREHFAIEHTTIQLECDQCNDGALICTPMTLTAHDHDHGHVDAHDHSHAHDTHDTHDEHVYPASPVAVPA